MEINNLFKSTIYYCISIFIVFACSNNDLERNVLTKPKYINCDSLLNLKVDNSDLESITNKLLGCELDSSDLPIIGGVVIMKMQNKNEFDTLTYRSLINTVHKINNKKN